MPVYEHQCSNESCRYSFAIACKISERRKVTICEICGNDAPMIVSKGATHGDEAPWIDRHVRGSLQTPAEAKLNPITSRGHYKKHLKENNIVPLG